MTNEEVRELLSSGKFVPGDIVVTNESWDCQKGQFLGLIERGDNLSPFIYLLLTMPSNDSVRFRRSIMEKMMKTTGIIMDNAEELIDRSVLIAVPQEIAEIKSQANTSGRSSKFKVSGQGRFLSGIDKVLNHKRGNSGLEFL